MSKAGPAASKLGYDLMDENQVIWEPARNPAVAAVGSQSVVFFNKSKLDSALSKAEGRPRYKKIPYVRIASPGDRDNIVIRQVWIDEYGENIMADNVRFKQKWEEFLRTGEESNVSDGTPLEAVPFLSREQVEELKHFNIFTVEQLAHLNDINAARFMGVRALQQLAKDYLEAAKDGAVVTRLHGELEQMREREKQREKDLSEQAEMIRQLREMVEAQQRGIQARDAVVAPQNAAPPMPLPEVVEPSKVEKSGFLKPKKG